MEEKEALSRADLERSYPDGISDSDLQIEFTGLLRVGSVVTIDCGLTKETGSIYATNDSGVYIVLESGQTFKCPWKYLVRVEVVADSRADFLSQCGFEPNSRVLVHLGNRVEPCTLVAAIRGKVACLAEYSNPCSRYQREPVFHLVNASDLVLDPNY